LINPSGGRFFQIPSFAQLSFRKPGPYANLSLKGTSSFFPLFLCERRVLLVFSLFFFTFHSVRRVAIAELDGTPSCSPTHLLWMHAYCSKCPGIQKSIPVFHLRINQKLNTIKKKRAQVFPAGGKVL
jgi:hypothetical protein